jgi:hypothetical protein
LRPCAHAARQRMLLRINVLPEARGAASEACLRHSASAGARPAMSFWPLFPAAALVISLNARCEGESQQTRTFGGDYG